MKFSQQVAQRVEELLREQLIELGINPAKLEPHEISEHMQCDIYPDDSMVYSWKETPILRVEPEKDDDGTVVNWRMFTQNDEEVTDDSTPPVQ